VSTSLKTLKDRVRELQTQLVDLKKQRHIEDSDRFATLPSDQLTKQLTSMKLERDSALKQLREAEDQLQKLRDSSKGAKSDNYIFLEPDAVRSVTCDLARKV